MAAKGSNKKTTTPRVSRLVLAEHLDIDNAEKLHARLKKCAANGGNVNLNAARVETIDTSSLQLLIAFVSQVCKNGRMVNWQSPSEALIKSAGTSGLEAYLHLNTATGQAPFDAVASRK